MAKKILIIGYLWPWCKTKSGGARGNILCKYFHKYDIYCYVVTAKLLESHPQYEDCRIYEVEYIGLFEKVYYSKFGISQNTRNKNSSNLKCNNTDKSLKKKIISLLKISINEIFYIPDSERGWIKHAFHKAESIIKYNNIDAVISIGPPHSSHIVAKKIKDKYGIFWIADLCHLWVQDHGYTHSIIRKKIDLIIEKNTLEMADVITTVSESLKNSIKKSIPNSKVYSIPHGYDHEAFQLTSKKISDKFILTYTGSLHKDYREPSLLFRALRELLNEGKICSEQIDIQFYGPKDIWFDTLVDTYSLNNIVNHYGIIDHRTIPDVLCNSTALIFLMWNEPNQNGMITTKIFEYLGAKRLILAIGGDKDVIVDILDKTNSGIWVRDVENLKKLLYDLYYKYREKGYLDYYGKINDIESYSYLNTVGQFRSLLKE